jgi:hypothetical protein
LLGPYSPIAQDGYPHLPNHLWWVRKLNPNCHVMSCKLMRIQCLICNVIVTKCVFSNFIWFAGIIENDDIRLVNSEIERALNFSRKCGMLVDTVKKKYKHRFVCLYICLTTSVSQTLLLSSVQFHSIQSNFVHQEIKVLYLYPLLYVRIFAVLSSRLSSTFYKFAHLLQKLNASDFM